MKNQPKLPYYVRPIKQDILKYLDGKPKHMLMLWGPRQSGKSTLIQQTLRHYPGPYQYINVDDFEPEHIIDFPELMQKPKSSRLSLWMREHWQKARSCAQASSQPFVLVIDEVQMIPNWAQRVKGMYDRDRWDGHQVHVVLLGSSPRNLQKGISESLLGRFYPMDIPHWSYSEMKEAFGFSVDDYIFYGGYPGAASYAGPDQYLEWKNYVQTAVIDGNLERDIFELIEIHYPDVMDQVFKIGAHASSQLMDIKKVIEKFTYETQQQLKKEDFPHILVMRYLTILSKVSMLTSITKYARDPFKRRRTPKFQVLNTGLMSATHTLTFEEAKQSPAYWGRLAESAVGAHLLNTLHPSASLHYWRYNGDEVDFVVDRTITLTAIEVKTAKKNKPLKGLQTFCQKFPVTRSLVVGTGGISFEEFLSKPATWWCEEEL